jgi:hypothetical protein
MQDKINALIHERLNRNGYFVEHYREMPIRRSAGTHPTHRLTAPLRKSPWAARLASIYLDFIEIPLEGDDCLLESASLQLPR